MYKLPYIIIVITNSVGKCSAAMPVACIVLVGVGKLTVSKGIVELNFLCEHVDAQHQDTCMKHETGISVEH